MAEDLVEACLEEEESKTMITLKDHMDRTSHKAEVSEPRWTLT